MGTKAAIGVFWEEEEEDRWRSLRDLVRRRERVVFPVERCELVNWDYTDGPIMGLCLSLAGMMSLRT